VKRSFEIFFRGIDSSAWLRIAYFLTIVCFATVPLHFLALGQSAKILAYLSIFVLFFDLLVALLNRPRDARLAFYGFLACLIHAVQMGD
jgi:hypothetical protein